MSNKENEPIEGAYVQAWVWVPSPVDDREISDSEFRDIARLDYQVDGEIEIDDDAMVSHVDRGPDPILIVVESGLVSAVNAPPSHRVVIADYDAEGVTEDDIAGDPSYKTITDGASSVLVHVYEFDGPPVEYGPLIELAKEAIRETQQS